MNERKMLNCLIENGIDFLHKSIEELDEHPKFSMINFHAAMELFLKARLMVEHWSLVVSQRENLNFDKFISGDSRSVSLTTAAERLDLVVKSGLKPDELDAFHEIANHRNRMVHFFHPISSAEEKLEETQTVVRQQLKAWWFLHRILTVRWKDVFGKWADEFSQIDIELKKMHTYLEIVYAKYKLEIDEKIKNGEIVEKCPSCNFQSQLHEKEKNIIYVANCIVCDLSTKSLWIECPSCAGRVFFIAEGFGECSCCPRTFEPSDLVCELLDPERMHTARKDGDDSYDLGNCSDCDGFETVVQLDSETYLCTSCFLELEHIQKCQSCATPNTGDMSDSSWAGCNHCDGAVGRYAND